MTTNRSKRAIWTTRLAALGLCATTAWAATIVPLPGVTHADTTSDSGAICTENDTASFVLTAKTGRIITPDGNSVYMWSYSPGNGGFQYPGPMLCVSEGQTVTVTLQNTLDVSTSIFFEGVEGVVADGLPASAQTDGSGRLTSLIQPAAPGGSVTYEFTAPPAGTYLYWSGTDPQLQREMGLTGALIVRPTGYDAANPTVYGTDASSYNGATPSLPIQEYVHLFSQVDPSLHLAVETGQAIDFSTYRPRYFMINGRSFPDTIAPNNAPWLPSQPYGALVEVQAIGGGQTEPSVIRYLNASPIAVPFHPHSNHEEIIGTDARPAADDAGISSLDMFAIDVQPGQTMEGRFAWADTVWNGGGSTPEVPDARNLQDGGYWSGEVRLGASGPKPPGGDSFNECGEYYHVAHNHALYAATNYGAAMGGQLTLVRIDPQGGC